MDCGSRTEALGRVLKDTGTDALLATSSVSMGYLHGLFESGHERFMALAVNADGDCALICPGLTVNQAQRHGINDIRPWKDGEDPMALAQELLTGWQAKTVALDDEMLALHILGLQRAMPDIELKRGGPLLARLTRIKTPLEIEVLKRAGAVADQTWPDIAAAVKPGMTEFDLERVASDGMRERGAKPTFAIVGTGANGAEPHHMTDDTKIQQGDVVVVDFGCEVEHYQSDITRCISVGEPDPEAHEVYKIVYEAHMAARSAIKPGVACEDIDRAAREVINNAGYGEFFTHRTGHGLGMRVHEEPYIVAGNREPLEVGHVFSIEPGIYLPGRFGVRIENIVCVTEGGHESLNAEPPSEL